MTSPHRPLDSFESALLTELREHVITHPADRPTLPDRVTALAPRRRRRVRLALSAAAVGTAATVAAVVGLGTGGGSPAYAVEKDSHGDVVATIHRLDDAAGLEKALRAQGIDADVTYRADGSTGEFSATGPDGAPADGAPPPGGALTQKQGGDGPSHVQSGGQAGGQQGQDSGPSTSGPGFTGPNGDHSDACGAPGAPPATLTHSGGDWVLSIPAGSPLQDRHVDIGTDSSGGLFVQYAGSQPGSYCGVMTRGAPLAGSQGTGPGTP